MVDEDLLGMAVPTRALGHRQCMEMLVRQECDQERREEQLKELQDKLREETERRRVLPSVMKRPA